MEGCFNVDFDVVLHMEVGKMVVLLFCFVLIGAFCVGVLCVVVEGFVVYGYEFGMVF